MKKESYLKRMVGSLLTAVLAILGFSSCKEELMYGTPHGEFEISGIVTDEAGDPMEGMRVISRSRRSTGDDSEYGYSTTENCDTVYTDSKGHYVIEQETIAGPKWAFVLAEDPDGGYESAYEELNLKYHGGDHDWYFGKAVATADFVLKKTEE